MNVLVTGASGLLGREILQVFKAQQNANVVGVWNTNELDPK